MRGDPLRQARPAAVAVRQRLRDLRLQPEDALPVALDVPRFADARRRPVRSWRRVAVVAAVIGDMDELVAHGDATELARHEVAPAKPVAVPERPVAHRA